MAIEKDVKSRIQHKHDIEVNWNKATGFIPKAGEIIVYDADSSYSYPRIKIGDGIKTVIELKFIDEEKVNKNEIPTIQLITWGDDD